MPLYPDHEHFVSREYFLPLVKLIAVLGEENRHAYAIVELFLQNFEGETTPIKSTISSNIYSLFERKYLKREKVEGKMGPDSRTNTRARQKKYIYQLTEAAIQELNASEE